MIDRWEPEDICNHQEHHQGEGALLQPRAAFKSRGKSPPTVATAPLRAYGEGPFSKVTVQSLL